MFLQVRLDLSKITWQLLQTGLRRVSPVLCSSHTSLLPSHTTAPINGTVGKSFTFLNLTLFWVKSSVRSPSLALKSSEAVSPSQAWEPAYTCLLSCTFLWIETLSEKTPAFKMVLKVTTCMSFTPTQHIRQDTGKVGLWEPASTKEDCVQNILPQPHTNFLCGTMSADPFKPQWQT